MRANRERLYKHYKAAGYGKALDNLLARDPSLANLDKAEAEAKAKAATAAKAAAAKAANKAKAEAKAKAGEV